MRINLYATLRAAAGAPYVELPQSDAAPARHILHTLSDAHPALAVEFWDAAGHWRDHIKVFLNGRDLTHLEGLETTVKPEDQLDIFPPVGGGSEARMGRVTVKLTGNVWGRLGVPEIQFPFGGGTLGELLNSFFTEYPARDLILDDAGNILAWSRVVVNGRFSYLVGGMDASVHDGDTVVLMRPYATAF